MTDVIKIIRISIKRSFLKLRNDSPLFCKAIWKNIWISNIYFNHINWEAKKRKLKEIILRLSIINIIDEILEKWFLYEKRSRKNENFIYYEIQYEIEWEIFCLILSENKKSSKIILLSWFIKYKKSC